MGHQVIKQPDGNYAVWSSIVDNFIILNATKEELVKYYIQEESQRIEDMVTEMVNEAEDTTKVVQFAITFEGALGRIAELHGREEAKSVLDEIAKDKQ